MPNTSNPASLFETAVFSIHLSFPPLSVSLAGGPNFWRYGLSWSGSTRPYWSSFGWAQLWLALHWRLVKSPNHFVLTSAFVTQCCRWLWQREEWGIKIHSMVKTEWQMCYKISIGIIMHMSINSLKLHYSLCFSTWLCYIFYQN